MGEPTDAELLMQFTKHGDDDSFRLLVERHYGLVMGVCRNILRSSHDAEDAFQATFLILARRCRSIRQLNCVAGWLQRVAYRTSIRLARQKSRRGEVTLDSTEELPATADSSLRAIHDVETMHRFYEELDRLPIKLRNALVLFYLEGLPRRQAAESLECTDSALKGRLAQGKKLLRQRLLRRGLALSIVAPIVIAGHRQEAAASTAIINETARLGTKFTRHPSVMGSETPPTSLALANQGVHEMMRITLLQPLTAMTAAAVVMTAVASGVGEERSAANASNPSPTDTIDLVAQHGTRPAPVTANQFIAAGGDNTLRAATAGPAVTASYVSVAQAADEGKVELEHQARLLKLQIESAALELRAKELAHQVLLAENESESLQLKKQAAMAELRALKLKHEIKTFELQHQLKLVEAKSKRLSQISTTTSATGQLALTLQPSPVANVTRRTTASSVAVPAANHWQPLVAHPTATSTKPADGRIRAGAVLRVEIIAGGLLNASSIVEGQFVVDANGQLALGAALGRWDVDGLTCIDAETMLRDHVRKELDGVIHNSDDVRVQITVQPSASPYRARPVR